MQKTFILGILFTCTTALYSSNSRNELQTPPIMQPKQLGDQFNESIRLSDRGCSPEEDSELTKESGFFAPSPTPEHSNRQSPTTVEQNAIPNTASVRPQNLHSISFVPTRLQTQQKSIITQKTKRLLALTGYFTDHTESFLSSNASFAQITNHLAKTDEYRSLIGNSNLDIEQIKELATKLLELENYFADDTESSLNSNSSFTQQSNHFAKVLEYRKLIDLLFNKE